MGYNQGAYTRFVTLPVPDRPEIHSARNINAKTERYTIDSTTGGFESMSATVQRVYLLVAFSERVAKFITDQDLERERRAIIASLDPLTDGTEPAITLYSVTVERIRMGTVSRTVKFKDLTTGKDETVQV